MPVRDPKNKTISFRLSEHEYTAAEQVSREQNFQSMSDFARSAVLAYTENPSETGVTAELKSIKRRVNAVMQQVADFAKRLGNS